MYVNVLNILSPLPTLYLHSATATDSYLTVLTLAAVHNNTISGVYTAVSTILHISDHVTMNVIAHHSRMVNIALLCVHDL